MDDSMKNYLSELAKRIDFIQGLAITDYEGGSLMIHLNEKILNNIVEVGEDKLTEQEEQKMNLGFNLTQYITSSLDQINKIEKWKTKYIVSIYDQSTFFQAKVNKNLLVHLICDTKTFNYELMKEIVNEISTRMATVDKEIESVIINDPLQ